MRDFLQRTRKDLLFVALLFLLAALACHRWFGPDLWFHIAWGRNLLEQGRFVPVMPVLLQDPIRCNQYWFFQTVVNGVFALGGTTLITLFFVLLWLGIASMWLYVARVRLSPVWGPLLMLAFVACVQLRLEFRPETFSYFFLSVFLLVLTARPGRWRLPVLALVEILWANSHSYFIFGPALAVAYAISARESWRQGALLVAAVSASTLLNPCGWRIAESIWLTVRLLNELGAGLEELIPTYRVAPWFWPMPVFWTYYGFVLVCTLRFLRRRQHIFACLLALGALAAGLRSFRFIPIFMIVTGPLVGAWLKSEAALWGARASRVVTAAVAGVTVFAYGAVLSGAYHRWQQSGTTFGIGLDAAEYPIGAADYLKQIGFKGRLFNEPNDGGYFEYHLPEATFTSDSNYITASTANVYFQAEQNAGAFAELDRRLHFDGALIYVSNAELVLHLLDSKDWVSVYSDSHRILFLRRERFAALERPLHEGRHYSGDDLRRFSYKDQPALWMALAGNRGDIALARKLIEEFSTAPAVPAEFTKPALQFALSQSDRVLWNQVLDLTVKTFGSKEDTEFERAVAQLKAWLR